MFWLSPNTPFRFSLEAGNPQSIVHAVDSPHERGVKSELQLNVRDGSC
jgi:hypothetical protein